MLYGIALFLIWILLGLFGGCAIWHAAPTAGSAPSQLPTSQLASDSVVLETVTFRLPWGSVRNDELWKDVDELRVAADVRRRLLDNGFRLGVLSLRIPPQLQEHLEKEVGTAPQQLSGADDFVSTPQRFQRRPGVPFELASPESHPRLAVLRKREDGRLEGETFRHAQCSLVAKPYPRGDSDVDLWIEPIIVAGTPSQKFVPKDGNFTFEVSPDKHFFPDLRFTARLAPGESLLMTCTEEAKGLGKAFFTDETLGSRRQRLVVIRLSHTQQDDLFDGTHTQPNLAAAY